MRKPYLFCLSISLLLLLTSVAGCKELYFKSVWRQTEIKADGADSEWSSSLVYLEENNIGIGLQNDANNLYIIVKAMDRNTRLTIMRMGLTTWLDRSGKNKKNVGIHYPIGIQASGIPLVMDHQSGESYNEWQGRFKEMLNEIEILGPEKNDKNRVPRTNGFGIETSISDTMGVMLYKLKVPLKSTKEFPYAINANPGQLISLGLETGKFNREMMKGNRPTGGGMSGRRGGMPHGDMPHGGGRGAMMSEPIEFWAKVSLAKAEVDEK